MALNGKPKPIRAFIAVALPQHVVVSLAAIQQQLISHQFKIRWVKPENIHITLKFLGDIVPDILLPVRQALTQAVGNHSMFDLTAAGLGVFPGGGRPKVIWTGIAGQIERLGQVRQDIVDRLLPLGFESEKRGFKAHLTLGRVKGPVDKAQLTAALQQIARFEAIPFRVERIDLYQSQLQPAGAVYSRLFSVVLASHGDDAR